ncbi:MAG: putative transporter substrate-binding protein [Homoserinimonas sp.]|jgi:iron complex transport system substrate-binding protein|nr:putative transporter substrate-binding protein [Homoserinimonas sp.]
MRLASLLTLSAATLLLSACAAGAQSIRPQASVTPKTSVTTLNCGTKVTFDSPPQRVITIKSTSTEMLLALGLGERIIGTGFQDGPLPERFADAQLPVLAERVPSQEVTLAAEPDLIYAGWESNFSSEGVGERADLEALGVHTYVSPSACQSLGQPDKLSFEHIWSDIAEIAAIFDVNAGELIAEQRDALAEIDAVDGAPTALWFSSGAATPYVGAGIGAPQLILETIGLVNIAANVDATWAPYNWESVVEANPDVIVLVDSTWNSAEKKISVLQGNPATANLDAVIHKRYLVVPFAASEAGVRTVDAAVDLAHQLASLELRGG